ncbi:hypothetical protein E1B06_11635 [Brevibacillus laterosporus]|uniref:hypothetical protein n=1 Tax=Brevibacillus laterosporus TaxID=1465 RepID=UPI0024060E4A|nr:hypothetical protein [Brevibacillus laterosporus]MDF9412352.1 hypothetical protein [Brevibacillus laterosporus]
MPETVARDRLSKRTQRKLVRRKSSIRKIILLVVLFLFLSIGGTAGAIMWNVNDTLNKVTGEFCKTKRRLQEVIKVVADKLTNLDELPKLFKLLEVAGEHVHTDLFERTNNWSYNGL